MSGNALRVLGFNLLCVLGGCWWWKYSALISWSAVLLPNKHETVMRKRFSVRTRPIKMCWTLNLCFFMLSFDNLCVFLGYCQSTCLVRKKHVPYPCQKCTPYKGRVFPYKGRVFPYKSTYLLRTFPVLWQWLFLDILRHNIMIQGLNAISKS